jgi:hypothetical protein
VAGVIATIAALAVAIGAWTTVWRGVKNAAKLRFTLMRDPEFTNGSFEAGFAGWLVEGHIVLTTRDPVRPAVEGRGVVVFNMNDEPSSGASLSQTFATKIGQRYALAFDFGTVGAVADQALRVTIAGNGVLFDKMLRVAGLNGDPFYVPHRVSFVANSPSTILTFTDQSYTYVVIDGLLDNVRIVEESPRLPVVIADPGRTAVPQGREATFVVHAAGPGPLAYQWQFGGHDIPGATGRELRVAAADQSKAGNYSVVVTNPAGSITSSAATLTILPPEILLNGSFEYGSAGWIFSGPKAWNASISTNARYGVTDGTQLVHFNWGQHEAGGGLSQRIATVPGREYVLSFDVGAFSLLNHDEQRMRVTVRGATDLLSRDVVVFAPGTGGRYRRYQVSFIADATEATVAFDDRSLSTMNIDLLLDNVRVTEAAAGQSALTRTRSGRDTTPHRPPRSPAPPRL